MAGSVPIPIPGRSSTTTWRTSSTYTSDYFDDTNDTNSASSSLSTYYPRRKYLDSGYGTGNVSLEEKDSSGFRAQDDAQPKVKSTPLPGREDLQVFKKDIEPSFTARYREIMPELHRLLQRQLSSQLNSLLSGRLFQNARTKSRLAVQMSLRLMMVGKTIQDARAAIVVFTQGEQTSGLGRLLRQPVMQQLCQPDDGITPPFEVIVVGDPARKRRYLGDISAVFDETPSGHSSAVTYCGARIRLEAGLSMQSAVATLGGVVKLTFELGDSMLVGMTAGHVLEHLYLDGSDSDDDWAVEDVNTPLRSKPGRSLVGDLLYPSVGTLGDEDNDEGPESPPRDWALFEIDSGLKLKPNIIPRETDQGEYRQLFDRGSLGRSGRNQEYCMSSAPPENFPSHEPMEVVMIASNKARGNGVLFGELSHIPASIMLTNISDEPMVEAYMLTLDEKKDQTTGCADDVDTSTLGQIQDGHSGAWVVNPVSMEVYGHVVATDLTGDAYVIPLHATFDEIKKTMPGVQGVDLPTMGDLLEAALRRSSLAGNGVASLRRMSTSDADDGDGIAKTALSERPVKRGDNNGQQEDKCGKRTGGHGIQNRKVAYTADRDRRTSELFSLCLGGQGRGKDSKLRFTEPDSDLDSGYGSVDTPPMTMTARASDKVGHNDGVKSVSENDGSSCCPQVTRRERRRQQSFWLDSEESMAVSVW
ncbi:hypothetical protein QBC37DRAFT_424423 [Rhypophila decipiens]|uniref:Uncharacterized protein n=1 Tax=Rhypophila decipiens TaxID=261697 RepID=A0AAN6Y5W1_9PEZI|nr:hypothetical protein QBC37DRAFT_424423 [Rhypophila decipiens]